MVTTEIIAPEVPPELVEAHLSFFQRQVEIPGNYCFKRVTKVIMNDMNAYLFRYEKDENKGLMGEHFSFVVKEKPCSILGFTFMDRKYSDLNMLSRKETEKIARAFLKKVDSGLNEELENLWTERHDEQLTVEDSKSIVAGMKYKCFRSSQDDYVWVIVGFDGTIITYERNIKWNTKEQKRITEKWLHDGWLNGKGLK